MTEVIFILDNKYFNESSQFHEDLAAIYAVGGFKRNHSLFDVAVNDVDVDVGVYSNF